MARKPEFSPIRKTAAVQACILSMAREHSRVSGTDLAERLQALQREYSPEFDFSQWTGGSVLPEVLEGLVRDRYLEAVDVENEEYPHPASADWIYLEFIPTPKASAHLAVYGTVWEQALEYFQKRNGHSRRNGK